MRSETAYTLFDFTEELATAFGGEARSRAVALMLAAHRQGLKHQEEVLTSAAIMLCGDRYRPAITEFG